MFDFIEVLFSSVWELFGIEYPGTGMSFATIAIGALAVVLSLRILGAVTGFSFSGNDAAAVNGLLTGFGRKGGNSKAIVVSEERKGDRF